MLPNMACHSQANTQLATPQQPLVLSLKMYACRLAMRAHPTSATLRLSALSSLWC